MKDFVTTVRQDRDEIYKRLKDTQDDRSLMSGKLNLLRRDRRSHARTARLMKSETRASYRRCQARLLKALTLLRTLQTQMVAPQSQQRPARDPTHPDKMAPMKRTTMESLATTTTTKPVTNAQLKELALLCGRMFLEEFDKIDKYVYGLPDMIHRSVMASKPKKM
nr:hypothetical protein [Tanacetum cinerariifolium]